jgi:hypothetical protein
MARPQYDTPLVHSVPLVPSMPWFVRWPQSRREINPYYCSLCHWPKCEHIQGSIDFSLQTQFFAVCLNFQQQNSLKTQYLLHLISSENCEIKSIKSDSLKAFQQHQEHPQIPMQFSTLILFNFHEKNGSIISIFHTVASKSLKPIRCTPTHRELFEYIKSMAWSTVVWEISAWQTKQTTLLHR